MNDEMIIATLRKTLQKLCDAANATAETCNTNQMDEAIAHAYAVLDATSEQGTVQP